MDLFWKEEGKRNKRGVLFQVVFIIMLVFGIFLCADEGFAKTVIFNKKNFPDKAMREALYDYTIGEKMTKSDLNDEDGLEIDGGKRKVNLKGIEYFPKLSMLELYETAKSREFPPIPKLESLVYSNDAIEKLKLPRYSKLKAVDIKGKKMESLDLSNNKQIQSIGLHAPKLQKLVLSQFSQLRVLYLEKMNLPELDLSYNSYLEELEIEKTILPGLDLSHNPELKILELTDTNLAHSSGVRMPGSAETPRTLDLSYNLQLTSISLKRVRGITFDPTSERLEEGTTGVEISPLGFDPASLGKLKKLVLDDQDMEIFELSDHPALESLTIRNDGKLQKIVIKGCKKLKTLTIKNNHSLREIQIEGCTKLKELTVQKNPLLEQILSGEDEKLTSLSVKECKNMRDLDHMNLSQLKKLWLVSTAVSDLSTKRFPKLEKLSVYQNKIKKVDFQSLKNLETLEVRYEKSTKSLDVSRFPKLRKLIWTDGILKKVNFGKNSRKMYYINLNDNRLSGKWDMGKFKNLEELRLNNNRITSIDFGKRDQIESVFCRNNRLKTFKSVEALNLFELDCRDNPGVQIYMCHSDDECMDWRFGKKSKVYYKYG